MEKSYSLNFYGYFVDSVGLPANSGIYCVYACVHNAAAQTVDLRRLLYIGEAANVRSRVDGHERRKIWELELQRGEVLCYSSALIRPESDRQRAEAAMIHQHKPPWNVEYVDSFPFGTTTVSTDGRNALLSPYFTVYSTTGREIHTLLRGTTPW
ncbi:MAG: GIY-YIG nuclease family protein [Bryobacterales bacterium]|nr:GIY-YIG nuclease family protein [Bryobacterales bacterium]